MKKSKYQVESLNLNDKQSDRFLVTINGHQLEIGKCHVRRVTGASLAPVGLLVDYRDHRNSIDEHTYQSSFPDKSSIWAFFEAYSSEEPKAPLLDHDHSQAIYEGMSAPVKLIIERTVNDLWEAHGQYIFADKANFSMWLNEPNIDLNDIRPKDLLVYKKGVKEIKDILGRLEYGILA